MAGRQAPTFIKRQKEQKRSAKSAAKRAAQQARRDERSARAKAADSLEEEIAAATVEPETPRDSEPSA